MPFVAYTDQMFNDLGMQSTSFENDNRAALQCPTSILTPGYSWVTNIVGDGALFSSLRDQLKWEQILQTDQSHTVTADVIEKSQQLIPGSEIKNYGYGIEFRTYQNEPLLFHAGATGAWKAITYRPR